MSVRPSPAERAAGLAVPALCALVALAALVSDSWATLAPNRLLPGSSIPAAGVLGGGRFVLAAAAVLALLLLAAGGRGKAFAAFGLAAGGVLLALGLTGRAAIGLLEGAGPAARAGLGTGAWVHGAALALLAAEACRRAGPAAGLALAAVAAAAVALIAAGTLDSLSIMVEARGRGADLARALRQHLLLTAAALCLAGAIAVLVAVAGVLSARAAAAGGALLGIVQVVPALALFGLLVPALSLLLGQFPALRALGFGAIGATPAVIGVGLYLALPLASALTAGLRGVDPAVVEAATALGYGRLRILAQVRWPLARPAVIGGLRVAAVQGIGLVTLGGLVGAGGFGALVFEGMAQFAPDLILLAALPIVALALAADRGLSMLDAGEGRA